MTVDVQKNDGCIHGDCANGFGILRYRKTIGKSGDYIYIGEWKNKKKHGRGSYSDSYYNSKYVGEWRDDLRHGQGVLIVKDGIFSGQWEEGNMKGIMRYESDSLKYKGSFVADWERTPNYFPASGTIQWKDGSIYKGDFGSVEYNDKNKERHGRIAFKCGFPSGRGEYTSPEGRIYKGDFSCGAYPTYTLPEKIKYIGFILTDHGYYEYSLEVKEGKSPVQFSFLEVKRYNPLHSSVPRKPPSQMEMGLPVESPSR